MSSDNSEEDATEPSRIITWYTESDARDHDQAINLYVGSYDNQKLLRDHAKNSLKMSALLKINMFPLL